MSAGTEDGHALRWFVGVERVQAGRVTIAQVGGYINLAPRRMEFPGRWLTVCREGMVALRVEMMWEGAS